MGNSHLAPDFNGLSMAVMVYLIGAFLELERKAQLICIENGTVMPS